MADDLLAPSARSGGQLQRVSVKELVVQRLPKMLSALPTKRESALARFKQAAIGVAMTPSVSECTPESVASAIYACARLNLIPDPVLKQAYIIPFKKKATVVLGYPGLIELARRACPGLMIHTGVVFENDDYKIIGGTDTRVVINKFHWQRNFEPGGVICAFCAFKTPEASDYTTVIVPRHKLDDLAAAKGGHNSPWQTHFAEMSEKTAIRRAARLWTLSPDRQEDAERFREALAVDEGEELPPAPEADDPAAKEMFDGLTEGEHNIGGGR